MKKTIILPDIHNKIERAERIIKSECADRVIFLGDYFDDFGDTPTIAGETAAWLKWSLNQPNRVHLLGNHDLHYFSTSRIVCCSGYTQAKHWAIEPHFDTGDFKKLLWYYNLDDKWLLSHAGLHLKLVPKSCVTPDRNETFKNVTKYLDEVVITAIRSVYRNESFFLFQSGRARGGNQPVGGIIWCDCPKEFKPIPGVNQIFGHTAKHSPLWVNTVNGKYREIFYKKPIDDMLIYKAFIQGSTVELAMGVNPAALIPCTKYFTGTDSYNINIDTGLTYYLQWTGKKLFIKSINDL